jgi:hypothetical protein
MIDTRCQLSFLNLADRPDFMQTNWFKYQARLEDEIPFNPELADEATIDTFFKDLSCSIRRALEVSALKSRPRVDPRPPIPARIQAEIRLKMPLRRQWQIARDYILKAEVNRLLWLATHQLQEWGND